MGKIKHNPLKTHTKSPQTATGKMGEVPWIKINLLYKLSS
jgi:hypothetical protein